MQLIAGSSCTGSEATDQLSRDAVPLEAAEPLGSASAREAGARCHVWGRAAAGARSALKAQRRLERLLGPGRTAAAASPAICAADGDAFGWFWPRRCCTVTAARLRPHSPGAGFREQARADGRTGKREGGPGLRPGRGGVMAAR